MYKNFISKINADTSKILGYTLAVFGFVSVVIIRLLPGIKYPIQMLGYDFGFYLYALAHASKLDSFTMFGSALGGYSNPLFFLSYHLHLPSESTLIVLNLILSLVCGLFLYWLSNGKLAGFYVLVLFAFSIPQSGVYTIFLLKNSIGLIILLGACKAIEQKKYHWLILTTLLLFWFHRTTAIVYSMALLLYGFYALASKKVNKVLIYISLTIVAIAGYFLATLIFNIFFVNQNTFVQKGIFLEGVNVIKYLWPYLVGGIIGIYFAIKNNKYGLVVSLCLVSVVWIMFQLPFFQRLFIYLDISLVILTAYGLSELPREKFTAIFVSLLVVFIGWQSVSFNLNQQPLITKFDIQEIKTVSQAHPGYFVLATDSNDAPWLLGYSKDVRLGAPGLFEDNKSLQEWQGFWQGEKQIQFLSSYPKPLLVFSRFSLQPETENCLYKVSAHFYKFNCESQSIPTKN